MSYYDQDFIWPDPLLVEHDRCIWKVKRLRLEYSSEWIDLPSFTGPAIDVGMLDLVRLCGPAYLHRKGTLWAPIRFCRPLTAMEVIAFAASDEFPWEKALSV